MSKRDLSQDGGDGSTNYQAGQDIHVYGPTFTEMKEVAQHVYNANAVELAGTASDLAVARAERLVRALIDKIAQEIPERIAQMANPDVQTAVFEAQVGYARAGEESLKEDLIDLLAKRMKEDDRNLRTLALNEAIVCAPKLTEQQRRAIAWIFYLRETRPSETQSTEDYLKDLRGTVAHLGTDIPTGRADYRHMEYVGIGSIQLTEASFGEVVMKEADGQFTRGFSPSHIETELLTRLKDLKLVRQSFWDPELLQMVYGPYTRLEEILVQHGFAHDVPSLMHVGTNGRMSTEGVTEGVLANVPEIGPIRDAWESPTTGMKSFRLTSVGLALGNAYYSRAVGQNLPLSMWLP